MSQSDATPPAPVTRRRFLAHVVAPVAAAAAAPGLTALVGEDALAAAARAPARKKSAPPPPPVAAPAEVAGFPRPDFTVAKTPAEREALEKQWKQMVELVQGLRKTPVPVGAEFATGALAPRHLRREGI